MAQGTDLFSGSGADFPIHNIPPELQGPLTVPGVVPSVPNGAGTPNPLLGGATGAPTTPAPSAGQTDPSLTGGGGETPTGVFGGGTTGPAAWIAPIWEIVSRAGLLAAGFALVLIALVALLYDARSHAVRLAGG